MLVFSQSDSPGWIYGTAANHSPRIPIMTPWPPQAPTDSRASTGAAPVFARLPQAPTTSHHLQNPGAVGCSLLTSTSSTAGFLLYPLSVRQFVRSSPSYSSHHVLDFHLPSCDALRPSFQLHQSFPIAPIPGAGPRCSGYQPPQLQHHLDAPLRCPR